MIDDGQDKFAAKISSLVMVAPAVNFIRPHYHHNYNNMEKQDQAKLDQGEVQMGNFKKKYLKPFIKRLFTSNGMKRRTCLSGNPLQRTVESTRWT